MIAIRVALLVLYPVAVLSSCKSIRRWCFGFSQKSPPSSANSHPCASKQECRSGLAEWQVDRVLEKHNRFRAAHGACPLFYNKEIEDWTLASEGFDKTCTSGALTHNMISSFGENIAMEGGSLSLHQYDPGTAINRWYCDEEGCHDYDKDTITAGTRHFTQVVWKETLEVGCALCHKMDQFVTHVYLMCSYYKAGNVLATVGENVDLANAAVGKCATQSPTTTAPDTAPPVQGDECRVEPCGGGQVCADPNPAVSGDFTCTCSADRSSMQTGGPAVCALNECDSEPCGSGQTCVDPDTSSTVVNNFICTCSADASIVRTGSPAACSVDECASGTACGADQTCVDPNQTPQSIGDYTCSCTTSGYSNIGAPAQCAKEGECVNNPCQDTHAICSDPDPTSPGNFRCQCGSGATGASIGQAVVCTYNECASSPCGANQECTDGTETTALRGDFVCKCTSGTLAEATAVPALCAVPPPESTGGDDSSFPIWIPIVIGVAVLCICAAVVLCLMMRASKTQRKPASDLEERLSEPKEFPTPDNEPPEPTSPLLSSVRESVNEKDEKEEDSLLNPRERIPSLNVTSDGESAVGLTRDLAEPVMCRRAPSMTRPASFVNRTLNSTHNTVGSTPPRTYIASELDMGSHLDLGAPAMQTRSVRHKGVPPDQPGFGTNLTMSRLLQSSPTPKPKMLHV